MIAVNADGTASLLPDRIEEAPAGNPPRLFGTMTGPVVHAGVQATAFDGPLRLVATMDGARWLDLQAFRPDSQRLQGRISAEDGALMSPPRPWHGPASPLPDPDTAMRHALCAIWAQLCLGQEIAAAAAVDQALAADPSPGTAAGIRALADALGCALPEGIRERIDRLCENAMELSIGP